MATGTVYLDVDDEITSAAARIRDSEATKVALVVPYGSRISTSRMNFRLLSREAIVNNRRLSVVASDPATRALAASAGLPVFGSVAEYDAAAASAAATSAPPDAPLDDGPAPSGAAIAAAAARDTTPDTPPSDAEADSEAEDAGSAAVAATIAAAAAGAALAPAAATPGPSAPPLADPTLARNGPTAISDETQRVVLPPTASAPPSSPSGSVAAGLAASTLGTSRVATGPAVRVPVIPSRRLPRIGASAVVVAAVAILTIVAVAIAGWVYLPSAEIIVTPREEPIPPISLTVRADPDATSADPQAGVVPASRVEVPVSVSDTFTAKGRRVAEEAATGTVTFRNVDFTATNTIASGSVVSTQSGVRFKTNRAVTVPRAKLVGLQVIPSQADVAVTAVKPGTAGNVEPNTITVIPAREDPLTLSVRNKAATSGGTHDEFPQVSQADVDEAMTALTGQLEDAFTAAVADGAGAPQNATLYPETAALGDPTPTVDPKTLVGKEQESFELGLEATGNVIAVDDSPVRGIAKSRLMANVGSGYQLMEDSVDIEQGDATVANGDVSFPVTASASRVRVLDPADLLTLVKGKSLGEAKAALEPFGDVEITPWPAWVSSVPSIDSRVSLSIVRRDAAAGASGAPAPSRSP
ncbi:MAG: baseplate J/gp47 family protein [Chloroflexota bacterium]